MTKSNKETVFDTWFGLRERRALVTGASRGIGRALAEGLALAGAEVCVHYYQSAEAADETVAAIESAGGVAWKAQADLTDSAQAKSLFESVGEKWGGLDVLVNNAGDLIRRSRIMELDDELIDQVVRTNLHSMLYASREAIPLLKQGVSPSIVNIGSIAAHNGGANGAVLYAASKGAVLTLTRGLSKELAPDIRVNGIAPGVMMTDFHRTHSTQEALEGVVNGTPMNRLGESEDTVAPLLLLTGGGASFITGEVIEVNGGLWLA